MFTDARWGDDLPVAVLEKPADILRFKASIAKGERSRP